MEVEVHEREVGAMGGLVIDGEYVATAGLLKAKVILQICYISGKRLTRNNCFHWYWLAISPPKNRLLHN